MKKCELCGCAARMYCESDQASLCWDCDEKVHCANFLVAKHSRSLLCHVCQSQTPWKASGPKLGPTVSVCESCVTVHCKKQGRIVDKVSQSQRRNGDDEGDQEDYRDDDEEEEEEDEAEEEDMYDDYDDDDDGDGDEEEEEDEENQVVPWSGTSPSPLTTTPPPPVVSSSSSSSEEVFSSGGSSGFALKRMRENVNLDSDDEIGCSSSRPVYGNDEATSLGSIRPLKQPRTAELGQPVIGQDGSQSASRSTAIINSLQRLQHEMITDYDDPSATILGICKLSSDQGR